jgi:transglutaminase-like putative cysteine protease
VFYQLVHRTVYQYEDAVSVSHHTVRVTPRTLPQQRVLDFQLEVYPAPMVQTVREDYFGNIAGFLTVEGAHQTLDITARSQIKVLIAKPPVVEQTPEWEVLREECRAGALGAREASQFTFDSPLVRRCADFADYAASSFPAQQPILAGAVDLTRRIFEDFKFDPKATTVATPLEQVFAERKGVCQDFAQFQIACLRSLGLPARYVSGYLETLPPPGRPKLIGADASHAWVQVFCGEGGWIDLDPTNNLIPAERHITVAYGRDFSDVSPLRGVIVGSGKHRLKVSVDLAPVEQGR